ncbi:MAG TPA: bifunctional tetrahydrofolate synthase/dihydrofolate synthase [Steroidobacter sp.]|jgi:dihydrofolate synthase/folylpolyglutamate synthase|nr:bifunctional tetrahydrofolate synthase/dihydrofolate synthase [Steroidobacter sp.]
MREVPRSLSEWLSWQERLHPSPIDLGLDRLQRTLARLDWRPPRCPVVTIGGTNGKGSSAALTAAIIGATGRRVGVFTSPHLIRYQERITIAGREVCDASLVAAFERIDAARGADTLTFFEFNTLAALLVFETAGLDAIVLEVGMGGRLDAVNVVDADVALITSVALDHCDWLGGDVETIGAEKAGIFRPGRPAVFGSRSMPASVAGAAASLGAELLRLGHDFDWTRTADRWCWRGQKGVLDDLPRPALPGDIQFDNAAAVLCVLERLSDRLRIDRAAIEKGLREVRLPGRFQIIRRQHEWILDVAHNPAAAQTLAAQLTARPRAGRTIAVCGILGDKDIEGVAAALAGVIDAWVVAGLSGARAVPPAQLADRLKRAGAHVVAALEDVAQACALAEQLAHPEDRIVVFGSFLTVGPALERLQSAP